MLALISKSQSLGQENDDCLQIIAAFLEANGFVHRGQQSLADLLGDAEFDDFDFNKQDVLPLGPAHKSFVRKLLREAKQGIGNASAGVRSPIPEDGELSYENNEQNDQMKALGDMIAKYTKRAKSNEVHVETSKMLSQTCGNWGDAAYFMLPSPDGTNQMAKDLEKLREKNIAMPFVKMSLGKFLPEWHTEGYSEGFLLQPATLQPTLFRWAVAAQATGMLPMHVAMTHADICMRVAAEARSRGKHSTTAAAYDELVPKTLADMCLKGVSGFDPIKMLCTFDRELFEQAIQSADQRMFAARQHGSKSSSWDHKRNWQNSDPRNAGSSWQHRGQTKRPYESGSKSWDSKRSKF